jgi:hypothetical protein
MEQAAHQPARQQQRRGDGHQHDQRLVAGALGRDRRQHPPALLVQGIGQPGAQQLARRRVQAQDHRRGHDAEEQRDQGEPDQPGLFPRTGIVGILERRLAHLAEENDAVELDHGEAGQRRHQHHQRGRHRHHHVEPGVGQAGREQEALQQQPLGNEARQRRQAGAGNHAGQRQPGHPGHGMDQAAELAQAAFVGGVQHRAGAQEEQALEAGMGQAVVEHRGHRQRRQRIHAIGVEDQGQADGDGDQADVLDRGIRQQALHVALHRAVEHAEDRREQADRQGNHAPPPDRRVQQVEADAQQAVDRRLQHHPGHHRRHRRGRRRVRLRQPDVQRHQAGLGAEAGQRQQEGGGGPERRQFLLAHRGETVVAAAAGHDAEGKQDRDRADVGYQQVDEAGAADLFVPVVGGDQEEG